MVSLSKDTFKIVEEKDVIFFRNRVRETAARINMGLVNQTKLITAASELVRNMLRYANGGKALIEIVSKNAQSGIRLTFEDKGPGIKNVDEAMKDGFTTGKSLGLGLPGTKRLVNEFDIQSIIGKGTTIIIIRWKNG
jgi:serine/threonine-protein kinase RsbT